MHSFSLYLKNEEHTLLFHYYSKDKESCEDGRMEKFQQFFSLLTSFFRDNETMIEYKGM